MGGLRPRELTRRQRQWLGHLRAARQRGQTVRAYARRRRLSEAAMCQAAKDLRKRDHTGKETNLIEQQEEGILVGDP